VTEMLMCKWMRYKNLKSICFLRMNMVVQNEYLWEYFKTNLTINWDI